jgi:REP element-mobilizing transposase RayT
MARKLRIEYPGALYHVINRGNYRRDVFETTGAAEAFLRVLVEATSIYGWRIHAYVVMRNHYHFALETPQPNLIEGMHWLQGTLATRFNRFRKESGHLFQGRYQALLIENNEALCRVVDYIHLNPVRVGLLAPEQVADFRWSSLRPFIKSDRFRGLIAADWLEHRALADDTAGWRDYVQHLVELATDVSRQKELGFEALSKGWAIGTRGWAEAVAKDHAQHALSPGLAAEESRALRIASWESALSKALARANRQEIELSTSGKTAQWKVDLALEVRRHSGASVVWLAERMHLGTPATARSQLSEAKKRGTIA